MRIRLCFEFMCTFWYDFLAHLGKREKICSSFHLAHTALDHAYSTSLNIDHPYLTFLNMDHPYLTLMNEVKSYLRVNFKNWVQFSKRPNSQPIYVLDKSAILKISLAHPKMTKPSLFTYIQPWSTLNFHTTTY